MNSARKDDVQLFAAAEAVDMLQKQLAHRFPKHEARAWPDVAAAFASFEYEVPASFPEKHLQQARGRHVQIREDAFLLELFRLVWSAPRNQRKRWRTGADRFDLFLPNFRWNEPQYSDTPRTTGCQAARFFEKLFDLRLARER